MGTRPEVMRAIEISEPGGPDVLRLVERPVPAAGPGEVLIRVAAAGVNRPDVLQRMGEYPPPPGASDLPGLEVAGTIVETAPDAARADGRPLREGDEVCALVSGGGYAEQVAVPGPQCLPVPRGLDLTAAAAMPETFFTVWTNLVDGGRLAAGETLLVHGGTSGIGTTAIQIARALGARVVATAGSREKAEACVRLGAARAVDYRREDFVAAVREATGGLGADVILDIVGGEYAARNLDALARGGRLVVIGLLGGAKATINLGKLMQKRAILTGSTLRPRSVEDKGRIAAALLERVWPIVERGDIRPIVHATFPLARAADAHRLMESSAHVGKIVLTM